MYLVGYIYHQPLLGCRNHWILTVHQQKTWPTSYSIKPILIQHMHFYSYAPTKTSGNPKHLSTMIPWITYIDLPFLPICCHISLLTRYAVGRSVLLYTRFCNCLLDYDCFFCFFFFFYEFVNFNILYARTCLICIQF
jgi:hypothetical protein